jgi:hypothetical protein
MVACFIVFHFCLAKKKKKKKKRGVIRASSCNLHHGITRDFCISLPVLSLSAVNWIERYAVPKLPSHDSQCHQMVA